MGDMKGLYNIYFPCQMLFFIREISGQFCEISKKSHGEREGCPAL